MRYSEWKPRGVVRFENDLRSNWCNIVLTVLHFAILPLIQTVQHLRVELPSTSLIKSVNCEKACPMPPQNMLSPHHLAKTSRHLNMKLVACRW